MLNVYLVISQSIQFVCSVTEICYWLIINLKIKVNISRVNIDFIFMFFLCAKKMSQRNLL